MIPLILSGNIIINQEKTQIYLLYRKDHKHYETPGGKVKPEEVVDINNPTIQELEKVAERELSEEVSGIEKVISRVYFCSVEFTIPDGRKAVAHKFIVEVNGKLEPKENIFDPVKSRWLPVRTLEEYRLSPDLNLLVTNIKNYLMTKNIKNYCENK